MLRDNVPYALSKVLQEVRIVIQADKLVEQRGLRVEKRRVVEDTLASTLVIIG